MKPAHNKNYVFDEYMEPTVVDSTLSEIKPVKSNFVKPSDWGQDEEAVDLTYVEVNQPIPVPVAQHPTPWELFVVMMQKALHRMKENLRT